MFAVLFVFFNFALAFLAFYNFYYKRRKLPPGPTPWPLIGNTLSFAINPPGEKCFLEWRRKFGDVYTYWMGEQPVVCVASYEKMVETFQKDAETYAGRVTFQEFDKIIKGGTGGVIMMEGELWREHRRFAIHILRDFGLGKNLMQERILDEFSAMAAKIDQICSENGNDFVEMNIAHNYIDPAVGSVINNILFGYRFDGDHTEEFYWLKGTLSALFKNISGAVIPLLMWKPNLFISLPIFRERWKLHLKLLNDLYGFFQHQIDEHKKSIDFSDLDTPATDYVEAFLKEQKKRELMNTDNTFTNLQLKSMCFDLWVAGQETSSTTLAWAFAYLINHPWVIEKVHAELDDVIGAGNSRFITIADRPMLPYMNALINEVQRVANLVPLNVVHKLTKDVVIDGFSLPKGTAIVPQISAVLIDEEIFEKPNEFRPERFIDENGKLKRSDALIPFSLGKRQCLGEPLARMELFLFTANLLHRYEFGPSKEMPSLKRVQDAVATCSKYTCMVKKRFG